MKKLLGTLLLGLTLMSCGGKQSEQLVVYTNSGTNGRSEYLVEEAKKAGFDISVVAAGGTDISNRLQAEKNNPIADVVFGLNAIEYEKLKKDNILVKFTPEWAADVPEGMSDKEGFYHAVTQTPLIAAYNEEAVGADIPTDWVQLVTDPKFKDKVSILNLGGGTGKAVFASVISRYPDPNGEHGISNEGWEVARMYFENTHLVTGEEDFWGNMMSGKYPITMIWASGAIERGKKFNFKFGVMQPEIGVPTVVEQLAIISGTKKEAKAQEFINWLGSVEMQAKWAQNFGTIPALPKALEQAPVENQELASKVKPQNIDWKFVAENIDSWVEKAQLQFIK